MKNLKVDGTFDFQIAEAQAKNICTDGIAVF
jgi:hypothetical protein